MNKIINDYFINRKAKEKLKELLSGILNGKEKFIIEYKYGIRDDKPKTLDETIKLLRVSEEEVTGVEKKVAKALKEIIK